MDQKLFQYVLTHAKEIKTLESILNLMNWDQETMLPRGAADHRSAQQALLAGITHSKRLDDRYFEALNTLAETSQNEESNESIIVKKLLKDITKARKLPTSFIERYTAATSHAFSMWEKAKRESAWKLFEPHLEGIVDLIREKSALLGFSHHPLDPLLDEFEPELTCDEVSTLFSRLKPKLQNLLEKVKHTPFYQAEKNVCPATLEQQLQLSRELISLIGYDWTRSRLDTAEHPFSIATHPTDSRITIRRNHENTLDQLLSSLHEAGHSLYEMGLDREQYGTPLGEAASHGIHESQSRFWETIIGRSRFFNPILFEKLRPFSSFSSPDELYVTLNSVQCSLVRTRADEVTYPFHVFLRFEIEKELLGGSLSVKDIPERWKSGMKAMLGVEPTKDSDGCLQDIHWSVGSFGYFPSYVLGSMYAASFWYGIKKDIPDVEDLIKARNFQPIHSWLHEKVWKQGRRYTSKILVEKATGKPPTENEYLSYLEEKYTQLARDKQAGGQKQG